MIFRCAIYTRKSSDDGLEQEFNSLDAEREACEAYVTSQRHAGWIALPEMYEAGGLSGGTPIDMARAETSALAGSETPTLMRNWRRVIDIGIPSDVSQTGVNIS